MNLTDDFRSPAFKRGVKDAKLGVQPRETTGEYVKGYTSETRETKPNVDK